MAFREFKSKRGNRGSALTEKKSVGNNVDTDISIALLQRDNMRRVGNKKVFGTTFWSGAWLNSLSSIDFENRLPRGRSYALKGAIKKIELNKNQIVALVEGSRPTPYKVKISVPVFTDTEKEKLSELFRSKPAWLAGIFNKQLDENLATEALRIGVKIFPDSWKDFEMDCSCPDWALPCKHIAAVIYSLSIRIDLDPVLVLQLHSYDIRNALKHLRIKDEKAEIKINEIKITGASNKKKNVRLKESSFSIDYTQIQPLGDSLICLLPDRVSFAPDSLNPMLRKVFSKSLKLADELLNKTPDEKNRLSEFNSVHIEVSETLSFPKIILSRKKSTIVESISNWINRSVTVTPSSLNGLDPSLLLMREYSLLALHLIVKGCFIPAIYRMGNHYKIIWQPLLAKKNISDAISVLENKHFPGLLILNSEEKVNEPCNLNKNENAFFILSLFISSILNEVSVQELKFDTVVQRFIFLQEPFSADKNKLLAEHISIWLKLLRLREQNIVPVFKVTCSDNLFNLEVLINDREKNIILSLSEFRDRPEYDDSRFELARTLLLLKPAFPEIENIINASGRETREYNCEEFSVVYFNFLPLIEMLGVEVIIPKELKKLSRPIKKLLASAKGRVSLLNLESILDFEWKMAIGENNYSEKEFRKLVKGMNGIIKLNNEFVYISKDEVNQLLENFNKPVNDHPVKLLAAMLAGDYDGKEIIISHSLKKEIKKLTEIKEIAVPSSIKAKLRPYQVSGFSWLYKNSTINFGSILADDMGLGKTLQAICLLQKLSDEKKLSKRKALLIVPTSLLTNWGAELDRFAPKLKWLIYHGQKRELQKLKEADIILTSYGTIRRDIEKLKKVEWEIVILDEAQNIKNPNTDQTISVKSLTAKTRIALSGTPVENRLNEYWSIMDFANKGLLGGLSAFQQKFSKPIEIDSDQERADTFRKITAPFMLRRLKTDKKIISDLPDKTVTNRITSLTKEQAALYENIVKEVMYEIENADGIQRRGLVFKMMTSLKQVCNHPANYLKNQLADPKHSGKTQMLFELLRESFDANEKTLLFTQYKEMGDLLVGLVNKEFGYEPLFLHGSLSRKQRDSMVQEFQNSSREKLFILSLKAGGTGLNLTAATNVIHYDLWWNPAVEEQATDRAYRIGQKKNVLVQRMITKGTLEEKIDAMIQSKKMLASITVSAGEKWIGELNDDELMDLVKIGSGNLV